MRFVIIFFGLFMLASCAFDPIDRGEANMLGLKPVTESHTPKAGLLVVAYPTAAGALDSSRVALEKPDGKDDYFTRTRWSDFLPVIVQTNLTESLSSSRIYKTVLSDENGLGDNLVLKPHIRHFEAVYPAYLERPPEIRIEMDFVLENVVSGKTVKSFILKSGQQAQANTTDAIHAAFVRGFEDIQQQLMTALK